MRRCGVGSLLAAYGMTLALQGCVPIVVGQPNVSEERAVVVGIFPGVGTIEYDREEPWSGRILWPVVLIPATVLANSVLLYPTLASVWQPGGWPHRGTSDSSRMCVANLVGYCKVAWAPDPALVAAWEKAQSDCFHSGTPAFDECMAARGFVRNAELQWVKGESPRQ
jgi:hypothetical protein